MTDQELGQQHFEDIELRKRVARTKISNYRARKKELETDLERLRILLAQSEGDDYMFLNDVYQEKMTELRKTNNNILYLKNLLAGNVDEKERFDIAILKQIPIDTLVEINKSGFFKIRDEKTPSTYWYKKTNRWTDFGTNESGDTIDLVMKLQNCDFYTACKYLSYK